MESGALAPEYSARRQKNQAADRPGYMQSDRSSQLAKNTATNITGMARAAPKIPNPY